MVKTTKSIRNTNCVFSQILDEVDVKEMFMNEIKSVFFMTVVFIFINSFIFQNLTFAQSDFTGYDVFVIAGQSNAVGVGTGPYTDDIKSRSLDKKIFQIGRIGAQNLKIIPATDVLQHFGYAKNKTQIGFGMAFARRYAQVMDSDRKVLLVPAAMGGTSILQWLGELPLKSTKTDSLVKDLKRRLSAAMTATTSSGNPLKNKFKGLLWMQGEADITKTVLRKDHMNEILYIQKLENLIAQILNDYPTEKVSVIVGEPSPEWVSIGGRIDLKPTKLLFRKNVMDWVNALDTRAFVFSDGLTSNPEGIGGGSVHYDATSQIKLGQLFYNKYLETIKIPITSELIYSPKLPSNIADPNRPLVKVSNPARVTHEVLLPDASNPTKRVAIGFSDTGGGYINSAIPTGFNSTIDNKNFAISDYGKGWQGSIRDEVHGRVYNPTQAGYSDRTGALAKLEVLDPRTLLVKQQAMTLWNGDGRFDFIEHKDDGVIHHAPYGSEMRDVDYLDESEKTVNDEEGSEFDFSSYNRSVAGIFSIPSLMHVEYAGYVRDPSTINQFLNPLAKKDDNKPVYNSSYLMKDISPLIDGNQATTSTDLSNIKMEIMGVRVTNNFHYAHFYTNEGTWVTENYSEINSRQNLRRCNIPLKNALPPFINSDSSKTTRNNENDCDLKYEVLILSTSINPRTGFAVGLYVPKNDDENKNQILVADISRGKVARTEDRRIDFLLTMDYQTPRGGFFSMRARQTIAGLLSPLGIGQQFNDKRRYSEFIRNKSYILFGTPQEIIEAIERTKPLQN